MTKMDIAVIVTLAVMMLVMLLFWVSILSNASVVFRQLLVHHCNCLSGPIELSQDVSWASSYVQQIQLLLICTVSKLAKPTWLARIIYCCGWLSNHLVKHVKHYSFILISGCPRPTTLKFIIIMVLSLMETSAICSLCLVVTWGVQTYRLLSILSSATVGCWVSFNI